MEKILSDTNTVTFNTKHKVNKEIQHFLDIESSIKNCVDDLFNNNYLSKENSKFLKSVGSKPGILYSLRKIHKCNSFTNDIPPFRTILSAIGTTTYNLAKFFVLIIKEFTVNEYTVRHSFSFCKEIEDQVSSLFMASFDIPKIALDKIWTKQETSVLIERFKINEK